MAEGRKNYWEEMQERDRITITNVLQNLGIKKEDISLRENLCVFPYKGRWIRIKIDGELSMSVYFFPEGSGYENLIKEPFLADDADGRWKTAKEFIKFSYTKGGARETAIKEILETAHPRNTGMQGIQAPPGP